MAGHMLIFGMGYTASILAGRLRGAGWQVTGVRRAGGDGNVRFDDRTAIYAAIGQASHILSSVPPDSDGNDPVLQHYGDAISSAGLSWVGYLSSTGVYGDTGGAWVDESGKLNGRRTGRNIADLAWQAIGGHVRIFRLPGIYGPGRSMFDRIKAGNAHRIDMPGQVFSRVHVEDITRAITASFAAPPGIYNLSDDFPCAQNLVVEYACALAGVEPPPLVRLDDAGLSPMARAFYAENRRIANGKAKAGLGWHPQYPDFRSGLRQIFADS